MQGLDRYKVCCEVTKAIARANNIDIINDCAAVKAKHEKKKPVKESNVSREAVSLSTNASATTNIDSPSPDDRKSKRGSAVSNNHVNLEKAWLIEIFESAIGERVEAEWTCQLNTRHDQETILGQSKIGWRNFDSKQKH